MSLVTCPNCGHQHEARSRTKTRRAKVSPVVDAFLKLKLPAGVAARSADFFPDGVPPERELSPEARAQFVYGQRGYLRGSFPISYDKAIFAAAHA